MRKKILTCLLIAVALICSGGRGLAFSPVWNPGDVWTVEARYAQSFGPSKWSEPVYWDYKVSESKNEAGEPVWLLEIRNKSDDALEIVARLSRDMGEWEVTKFRTVEEKEEVVEVDSGSRFPVLSGYSLAPFDFPVFPIQPGSSRTFKRLRPMGRESDLLIPEILRQETQETGKIPSDVFSELENSTRKLLEVKVSREGDDERFVQFWDSESAWPLYGENKFMIYRLVAE